MKHLNSFIKEPMLLQEIVQVQEKLWHLPYLLLNVSEERKFLEIIISANI